jgi:hypothetical protein
MSFYVVARRGLFPSTLAPYASAVSNLLMGGRLLRAKNKCALTMTYFVVSVTPLQKLKATEENTETKMKNRPRNHLDDAESSKNLNELCALCG